MPKKRKDAGAPAVKDDAETTEAPKRRKRLLLIPAVVIVVAAMAGGAVAGGLIGGGGAGAEAAEGTPEPTPTVSELGRVLELESVTINLTGGHFLKLGVAVEMSPEAPEVDPPTAPIYDAMIKLFTPMTMEALTDPATRDGTKAALLGSLAEVYGEDIVGIYFTEFVMQ